MKINYETIGDLHNGCFRVLRWGEDVNSVEIFDRDEQCFVALEGIGGQWHRHQEIEITLVESGTGIRIVGDESSKIPDSQSLVMLGRGLPHCWDFGEASAGICVQFSDVKLLSLLPEHSRVEVIELIENAAFGLEFGFPTLDVASRLLRRMAANDRSSNLGKLGNLLLLLSELSNAQRSSVRKISSTRFGGQFNDTNYIATQTAIGWIMENMQSEIRLQNVLDLVGMSKASFSRHFVRCTGLSFSRFVNELRVSNACRLLHSTDLSICAIALDSGFSNLSNFNRIFRQCKGTPPSRYRKTKLECQHAETKNRDRFSRVPIANPPVDFIMKNTER